MLRSTWGMGLAATKPSLPDLLMWPGDDAADMLSFVDIAKVACGVFPVLVGPQPAAMFEPDLRIFGRHFQDMRAVVPKGGREQQ